MSMCWSDSTQPLSQVEHEARDLKATVRRFVRRRDLIRVRGVAYTVLVAVIQ